MSEERKENQSVQTVSVTKSSVDAADTNTKNEDVKILGIVESCGHLRIRKEPNKESDVVATIPVGTMVELVNDEVIDGFYAVHTEVGDGYCMEDLIYTMVLSDGTIIENLRKNGDNYISASKLTADMFDGKLSEVTVKTSEDEMVMENMDLVQITEMNGEYWFVLRQFSATELAMAKMSSNIDFLAMMQDVEL